MSTRTKQNEWPKVMKFDSGIRQMTGMNQCCYCNRRVGSPHAKDCVTVTKRVRYRVIMDKKMVGVFISYDPHSWSLESMESHKNDSSWCSDNAMDSMEWTDKEAEVRVNDFIGDDDGPCSCSLLGFEVACVEDEGPFVQILDEEEIQLNFPNSPAAHSA